MFVSIVIASTWEAKYPVPASGTRKSWRLVQWGLNPRLFAVHLAQGAHVCGRGRLSACVRSLNRAL